MPTAAASSGIPDVLRDVGVVFGPAPVSSHPKVTRSFGLAAVQPGDAVWYACCTGAQRFCDSAGKRSLMILRQTLLNGVLAVVASAVAVAPVHAQTTETFTATAEVKTAGASTASSLITIVVARKMAQSEADRLIEAFKGGGAPGLRKALVGVPATGTVRLGIGEPTPSRLTIERPTDKGRLLTIVTDQPILFLGAGIPGAKAKEGYDFAIIDIEVDARGNGSGSLAPAAKVTLKQGVFVVEDYASELVRLTAVRKVK
jgi:hypothetical protein